MIKIVLFSALIAFVVSTTTTAAATTTTATNNCVVQIYYGTDSSCSGTGAMVNSRCLSLYNKFCV